MDIDLDTAMQTLDPNAQEVIINAAREWIAQRTIAPADTIRLLNTTTDETATVYEIEVDAAGTIGHINVFIRDDGSVIAQPAE